MWWLSSVNQLPCALNKHKQISWHAYNYITHNHKHVGVCVSLHLDLILDLCQFSSRWYLHAQESPYIHHPSVPFWNSSSCWSDKPFLILPRNVLNHFVYVCLRCVWCRQPILSSLPLPMPIFIGSRLSSRCSCPSANYSTATMVSKQMQHSDNNVNESFYDKNNVLFHVLSLQTGAHSPLQSKEPKHSQKKLLQARSNMHTHTHARTHTHTPVKPSLQ